MDEKAVGENHKDFMFLECILFITEVRAGQGGAGGGGYALRGFLEALASQDVLVCMDAAEGLRLGAFIKISRGFG